MTQQIKQLPGIGSVTGHDWFVQGLGKVCYEVKILLNIERLVRGKGSQLPYGIHNFA